MVPETAFERFYETHRDRLVATLHGSVVDLDLCASAVDEAMTRAFAQWSRIGHHPEPAAWVFVTARNVARKQLRRGQRYRAVSFDDRAAAVVGAVSVDAAGRDGVGGEVWSVVAELPERQREAVVLRHLLGLTERGVGEVMGVTRGTVSSTLRDAYHTLGVALRDEPERGSAGNPRCVGRQQATDRETGAET